MESIGKESNVYFVVIIHLITINGRFLLRGAAVEEPAVEELAMPGKPVGHPYSRSGRTIPVIGRDMLRTADCLTF